MKKLNELMKDLGFNESAPESTAKAFLSNLLEADRQSRRNPNRRVSEWETKKITKESKKESSQEVSVGEQLSFHFDELNHNLVKQESQKKSS